MRLPAFRRSIIAATLFASVASIPLIVTPASAQTQRMEMHGATPHATHVVMHRRRHRVWRNHHWVYYYR